MTAAEILAASIPIPLTHRYFDVGGRRLHAVTAGSGPAMVLVHGLNIGWGQWYAVLPELAKHFTVHAIDLGGAGDSGKIDLLTADIERTVLEGLDGALRALAPDGAIVVGHSMGGWAALKLASRRHPAIRAVVAVDAMGFTDVLPWRFRALALRPVARFLSTVAVRPTRKDLGAFLGDVMVDRSRMSPLFIDYFVEHALRPPVTHPLLLIHRLLEPFRVRRSLTLTPQELASIACPVVIFHGAHDPLIPIEAARPSSERLPHAMISVFEDVGHVPPIERPEEFTARTIAFARSLPH